MRNQFAIYRVNPMTAGKELWHKSYEEARALHLPVRLELYRMIHLEGNETEESAVEIWKRTSTEVSDVLAVNRNGELSCYYINEDHLQRIAGFIRINTSGALISPETRDYQISGYKGEWAAADDVIIDGKQFFLMENQQFRNQAAMIILDSYGRMITEVYKNRIDREAKEKIREYIHAQDPVQKHASWGDVKNRFTPWQKYFENGTYERSWESGLEVNYDAIDGCVNQQKYDPGKAADTKPKKKQSVIRRLRQKQIAIAKRSGKSVPRYLEQQLAREKV